MSSARLFQNKTFQAALARNRRDQELREQAERSRLASSPSNAAALPRPATSVLAASSDVILRRTTSQFTKESSMASSNSLAPRPQNSASPHTRPPALATFASSNPVTRDRSPVEPVAKRQRTHVNSPLGECSASDSPVTDCKSQSTPSTQMRPYGLQVHRAEHLLSPCPHPATPLNRESVPRLAAASVLQNYSPPTPARAVPRTPTASNLPFKSPVPQLQPPVNSVQTYSSRGLASLKFSPLNSMKNSHSSSLPPPNEPTPICTPSSAQRGFPFQVSAGFQNDGNTCYLSAALVILLSQAMFVTELVSEYSAASEDHRSDFVRDFPCLAELTSLATWKLCNPARHLRSGRIAGILRTAAAGGFKHGMQHDCHEALTFILSIAYEEETKLLKQRRQHSDSGAIDKNQQCLGVIAKNFGIEERVELTCTNCHDVRSKLDLGFIISLPLACSSSSQEMSVESVLSASADAESVEATCSKCNCLLAESRRSYFALGAHMIIQLKRFRWNVALGTDSKDSTSVALSPVLKICTSPAPAPAPPARSNSDLASTSRLLSFEGSDDDCQILENTDTSVQPQLGLSAQQFHKGNELRSSGASSGVLLPFSLVGNVMHTGRTLASGHYYADVLCNGSWIRVNDTSVSNIDWDPCRMQSPAWSNMAYVQIYARSSAHSRSQMPVLQV